MPSLPKISPELIKAYQDSLSASASPATAKRKSASLNKFFDWAETQGHIEANPMPQSPVAFASTQAMKPVRKNGRTFTVIGVTAGLAILVLLLVWRLKLPIQYIINFAQENGTNNPQLAQNQTPAPATINANSALNSSWNLFAKLKLTDSQGSPLAGPQNLSFKLFKDSTGGDAIYTSDSKSITTDTNGSALISLDRVPAQLFMGNNQLFLEPQLASNGGTIRIPVSTANTASNLQGYYPANPDTGAAEGTIPVVNKDGALVLASQSPAIKGPNGNLLIEGQTVTIKSTDGGGGNIEINPDANGYAHFLFEGNKGNFLNAQAPNLTSGSLYYGMVPNNSTGYYLMNLQNGSKLTTKFSVDAKGSASMAGNLAVGNVQRISSAGALQNITGYTQTGGNFTITQGVGDFASITKAGTALSDVLTLKLDENNIPGSHYSTLVLKRLGGDINSRALLVDSGDAQFNGQVQLGRFVTNPTAIGTASLVYNTTDNQIYFYNGSAWVSLGAASATPFSSITSGTNTQASMVVGTGASLTTSGTGTITATGITCAGCITNGSLANSALTINTAGILTGGGAVSLGGSINLTATEADTLNSVTTRGATTSNAISVGNLTSTGTTTFGGLTYTWPGSQSSSYVLQTNGTGTLSWVDPSAAVASSIFWNQANGALFPKNNSVDVTIGSNATSTAKFAFTNVLTGTPTASIAGSTANSAAYLTGNGNLAVTNMADLTLGGANTGRVVASSPFVAGSIIDTGLTASKGIFTDANKQLTSTGTLGVVQGGTGLTAYTIGDLLFADTTSSLARLADVATGNVLISGGVGVAPSWNKVVLGTHTTGNYVSTITGTANQITASAATGDVTLSIPSDFRAPGTVNAVNGIYTGATAGTQRIDASGNLVNIGNISASGYATISGSLALGNTSAVAGPGNLNMSGNLVTAGTTTFGGIAYTWPGSQTASYVLQTNGSGTLSWVDPTAAIASSIYWTQANGSLYPKNNSVDVLIGSSSTGSAKFAFTGVNSGTPTATIAGTTANLATYLTGNGNLAVTNGAHLTLGGASTGGIDFASTITSGTWNGSAIGATYGGTGQTSYAVGDILYANTTTSLAKLNDVATGNVLISGGANTAPSWGKVVLGTHTTGNYVSTITGTANQITASASTGDITLSIPSDFRAPGTVNAVNGIYTGTTAGTQRIDASGNLVNIGNISASGYATVSGSIAVGNANAAVGPGNLNMSGNLVVSGTTGFGGLIYTWPGSQSSGYVLSTNGSGTLSWSDPAVIAGASNYWNLTNGVLFPKSSATDLLIGSNATTSAKFAFTGVNSGTPTATIAGTTANAAVYLTGNGNLAVTNMGHLTLGGSSTGQVDVNNNLNLASGNAYLINGTSVLNATTLGTNVVTSSLTTVGALASGSIANGFGTIATSNTITGTTLNGTTGINTGAGAGTQRIDASGNLVNIGNITASGYATISGSLALGNTTAAIGPGNLNMSGNLVTAGTTTFGGLAYTWPATQTNNYVLSTNGSGTLSWVAQSGGSGTWTIANTGVIYPNGQTLDVLIGGTATTSAKFAFKNVLTGTPTASISGTSPVATFIDGNGNLSTTNRADLTIGNSATYNSTGNILLNPNGTGRVGIGTTAPGELLALGTPGSILGVLSFAGNTSGKVVMQPAAAAGSWSFTLPTDAGTANTVLTTDGTGITSWQPIPTASILTYYLQDTASDVATYKSQLITPFSPKTTLATAGLASGNTVLQNWITAAGSPGLTSIPAGSYDFHVHTSKTAGTKTAQVYAEIWEANSAGTDIALIGTTESSPVLTGSEGEFDLHFITANTYTFASQNSRIVTRVYAAVSGAGAAPTVNVYYGGTADSHLALPSQTIDASNFVPYVGATANVNLGTHSLSLANLTASGYATISASLALGNTTAAIGPGHLNMSGNLVVGGTTTFGGLAYTWPGSQSSGYVLSTNGSGTLSWVAQGAGGQWTLGSGILYPNSQTADVLIGGTATTSAKFAFENVLTGVPTASIAGTSPVATFIDGNGNLSTTNRANLTLGNSATYNTTGNILLNPNGTGDVGIGVVSPGAMLDVGGNIRSTTGTLQIGNTTNAVYSRFGTSTTSQGLSSASDLLISGNQELKGTLFLDGRIIANQSGISSIILSADPSAQSATMSAQNWTIENTANVGQAALMVNQKLGGDLFSASVSGTPEFTIHRDSSFTMAGTTTAPTAYTTPGTVYFNTTTKAVNGATTGDLFIRGEDSAWHRVSLDMTSYSATNATLANGSSVTVTHNQNTNDLTFTGWVYDTAASAWKTISNFTHNIIQNLQNQFDAIGNAKTRTQTRLTDIELAPSVNTGTGADGAITLTTTTSINAVNLIAGRSCTDGGDAVNYSVTALTSNTATTSVAPSAGCLAAGDEVLLINLLGIQNAISNVGNYETLRISNVSGTTITFTTNKLNYYGNNATDDTNIGTTAGTNQIVMLQRIPNYTNVTVPASDNFTATAFNGNKGGVMFFRATGAVTAAAQISTAGQGLPGGNPSSVCTSYGTPGYGVFYNADTSGRGGYGGALPGIAGKYSGGGGGGKSGTGAGGAGGAGSTSAGSTGGGAGGSACNYDAVTAGVGGGGGGGGNGTSGAGGMGVTAAGNGTTDQSGAGSAGAVGVSPSYNIGGGGGGGSNYSGAPPKLTKLFMGGGGGSGGAGYSTASSISIAGSNGGDGGGIVFISANSVTVSGAGFINARGGNGASFNTTYSGGGGGGGGGSILLAANTFSIGTNLVTAIGGTAGGTSYTNNYGDGGAGGDGVVALYSPNQPANGTSDPAYTFTTQPYYTYGLYHSATIATPNAVTLDKIRWDATPSAYGKIEFQTRTGASSDPTDGSWEAWKPAANASTCTGTSCISLGTESGTYYSSWTGNATFTIGAGDTTRNVTQFEDDKQLTAANLTKVSFANAFSVDANPTTLTTNLVSYWNLNENSNNGIPVTRVDAINANNLTDVSNVATRSGILGNAADPQGSKYLTCTDANCGGTTSTGLDIGSGAFSINAWVYNSGTGSKLGTNSIVSKGTASGQWSYELYLATGSGTLAGPPVFDLNNTDTTSSVAHVYLEASSTARFSSMAVGWHMITATFDPGTTTATLYVDNTSSASASVANGTLETDSTSDFRIAASGAVKQGVAMGAAAVPIDEVGVWKKALSVTEIGNLWNSQNANALSVPSGEYIGASPSSTDLSNYDYLTYWVNSSQSGNTIKFGFGQSVATEQEQTVTIDAANTWQKVYWDISGIPAASRNAVTKLRLTNLSANASTVYLGYVHGERLLNTSSGSPIQSTPSANIQYRAIFTTQNTAYQPQLNNVNIDYNDGFKIIQASDNNSVSMYNYTGATQNVRLDVTVFGADLAEWYTVDDPSIGSGDIVAISGKMDDTGVPILRKTNGKGDANVIGIISTKAGQTLGLQREDRRLLALAGRVPVKIDPASPAISAGDGITSSATPGMAKKAGPGDVVIAKAAQDWKTGDGATLFVIVSSSGGTNTYLAKMDDFGLVSNILTGSWDVVSKTTGEAIKATAAFSDMIAGSIKAGAIDVNNLTAKQLDSIAGTIENLVAKNIKTNLISPLADSTNVAVQIGSTATPSGEFVIQNASGSAVASVDSSGNATFSGTLYADAIKSKSLEDIQNLLTQVQTDQNLLKDAANWNVLTSTSSANLKEIATSDLYVTNQAAINTLSVTGSLAMGTDMVFSTGSKMENGNWKLENTLNTLSSPLKIQSLAMAPVEIMNGLIKIDTLGNVIVTGNLDIGGNLNVAGRVNSSGLTLKGSTLQGVDATTSASLLSLQDTEGNLVSSIDSSGSAAFHNLSTSGLTIAGATEATNAAIVNGVINTSSSVGNAIVPGGISEITIKNPKVTDYTLVYVTPTSSTLNYVLYIKSKKAGEFTVGFTNPIGVDVKFNWWIVQISN